MNLLLQRVQKKFLKKIYQIPFVQNQANIAYQIAIDQHKPNLPILSKDDQELVNELNNEGVVVTSLDKLGIISTTKLLKAARYLTSQIKFDINNDINKYVIHASVKQIMQYPEIFLWGLDQRLLNIVEHYIGLPIAYHGAYCRRDIANKLEEGSRLWHIDAEDRKVLKIIIYINDVTEDQGPFQYIPLSLTLKLAQSLNYTDGYIRNQTMQQLITSTDYKSCIGNSGTVIFAGTGSVFHRGKPPEKSDRFTIFFDYTSRRKKELFYINHFLSHPNLPKLSQNLSEQQKRCIFWQK